ncbi:34704_t:CDS:2, partial [Racocetra persica]
NYATKVKSNRTGFVPLKPIFSNDDENGYNEKDVNLPTTSHEVTASNNNYSVTTF